MSEHLTFRFKKPGLQTTVQDMGRFGHQASGIPLNGVMDKGATKAANWLVGNQPGHPILEITLMGPHIVATGSGQIALTGADLSPTINGIPAPMYETIEIDSGDEISFGRPITGCRAYLAIRGDWQIESWLDSYSASAVKGSELTPDSVISKDSELTVLVQDSIEPREINEQERPNLGALGDIRLMPGPEFSLLSNQSVASFFSQDFKISNDSNRMGYRLQGKIAEFNSPREVISSGIIPGTIQITNAGQPIVLMADAQTSGGYFRLGNVLSEDLDKLAQMKPGDHIRFRMVE